MKKILILTFIIFISFGCKKDTGILPMGMNISGVSYYHSQNLMFTDVMKTKHQIGTASYFQGGYKGSVDSDGYPLEVVKGSNPYFDPDAPTILINDMYVGDYVFLYDGEGEINFYDGIEVVERLENKIYLKLYLETKVNDPHRRIVINTSVKGNHVRNMRLIPVEYENKTVPLFNKAFLDGLKGQHVLRFMDAMATNSTRLVKFSDRPKVTDFSYDVNGLPLEILIELANTLMVDAWFNVPHMADDDFIYQMAKLIKDNLNKKLKCYIEYSNEIWHTGFAQGKWIDNPTNASEQIKNDLNNLVSPKYKSDNRHLKNAYFMARTFRIFKEVFEDSDRLVKVGTYYFWEYPYEIIEYLIDLDLKPDCIAGVGYFSFTEADHLNWIENIDTLTPEKIIDDVLANWENIEKNAKSFADIVNSFEIDFVVYEGGQHMQPFNQGVYNYNEILYQAQIHEKMYDLYVKNYNLYASFNCKLFVNFTYVSKRESQYGSWGLLETLTDIYSDNLKERAPKYQAMLDSNKR